MSADLERLLTPDDVAGLTGMSYDGVLRDIRAGKLTATRKGKGYLITRAWFTAWLDADIVHAPAAARSRPPVRSGPTRPQAGGSVAAIRAIEAEARTA